MTEEEKLKEEADTKHIFESFTDDNDVNKKDEVDKFF